ncbi:MAG: chalcone isomerase family protein [Planctomycetes bacterium]|nr:chalcone isomerase family protein [Planctomycetota bacterium]
MQRTLLVLALSFLTLGALRAADETETVREPKSKVEFPVRLVGATLAKGLPADAQGAARTLPDLRLCGTGLRTKTWFDVKVYALGLYWDERQGPEVFAAWRDRDAKRLANSADFYDALLEGRCALGLRLVMCRDVDGDDMAEAFEDALKPRLEAALKAEVRGKAEDLATFRKYFAVDEVKKDVELVFVRTKAGELVSRMNGELLGAIDSPALCRALFDVYLGSDPISKSSKKTLIGLVPGLFPVETER